MLLIRLSFSFLSFLSLLQLVYIIHQNIKFGDRRNPLLKVVFFMTISLSFFSLSLLCYYSPLVATDNWNSNVYNNTVGGQYVCLFITRLGSYAFLCSVLWYADLALMLYFLLSGFSVSWLRKHSAKQFIIVWIVSFLLWWLEIMPFFLGKKNEMLDYCWLSYDPSSGNNYDLPFHYLPVLITMVLSIVVLLMTLYHLRRRKTIIDISMFVGSFAIVMSMPSAHAITVYLGFTIPWLEECHYLILSMAGIIHYMVWISLARMSTMNLPIEKSLCEELVNNRRLWHSSFLISTLRSGPLKNTSIINSHGTAGSSTHPLYESCGPMTNTSFDSCSEDGI